MFGKKQLPTIGRQRPLPTADRRSAVFSYHSTNRAPRPGAGPNREGIAQQAVSNAAAERRASVSGRYGRWPLRIFAVVCLLLLVGNLFVIGQPRLERSSQAGSPVLLRDTTVYEQAAASLLDASAGNRTKLTLDSLGISQALARQYPELGAVTLTVPLIGWRPVLHIAPASPALIMSSSAGQSFVLDATGRALMPTSQAAGVGRLGLPVVTDQSGLALRARQVALPGSSARFITEVAGQLHAAHLVVTSLTLPKGANELDVRLEGVSYVVKFNLMGDARVGAGAYMAVKQQLEREHKSPASYVDVRVDGRAYYK